MSWSLLYLMIYYHLLEGAQNSEAAGDRTYQDRTLEVRRRYIRQFSSQHLHQCGRLSNALYVIQDVRVVIRVLEEAEKRWLGD